CVAGTAPCSVMQICDETHARCTAASCTHPDMDGDGHTATSCGGDDCDDTDPHRFPGNTEVCLTTMVSVDGGAPVLTRTDPASGLDPTHDEDCDPTTYANGATGDGDHDGDMAIDA